MKITNILSDKEMLLFQKFKNIKERSGSHSPSITEIQDSIKDINVKVDACYLSNPYATELFVNYLRTLNKEDITNIVEHYPSQNRKLAEYVANYIKVSSKNIIVGNGASEIISFFMNTLLEGKTLLPIPTFSPYYEYASEKNKILYFKLKESEKFIFPLNEIKKIIKDKEIDNVIIINPNNPNGYFVEIKELIEFIEDIYNFVSYIIIDESFIHFVDYSMPHIYELINLFPKKLIIAKSMSKDFGIAGLRLGYSICDEEIVNKMLKSGFLWNISGFGEYFLRLLAYNKQFQEEYEKVRIKYIQITRDFFQKLAKLIKVYPSKANFLLAKVPIESDLFVFLLLLRYGVYVRTTSDKIGLANGKFVRISSRTEEENEIVLKAIEEIMKDLNRD